MAVHVGQAGSLRTYPDDLRRELSAGLIEAGFEVCLTGEAGPGGTDRGVAPEHVRDMIGQTPTPADLAAVLQQMDIVITGDSFPMHLAGALDVPTIAVFASTDSVLGSDYPSVESVQSSARCSPCRIAGGPCPLAHGECIAHRDESVSPGSLVKRIRSAVGLPVSL